MRFAATEENVKVTGRTLFIEDTRYLGYSGSSISFTFTGKKADAYIWSNAGDFGDELKGYIAVFVREADIERQAGQGEGEVLALQACRDEGEERIIPVRRICLDREEALYSLYESSEEKRVTITVMKYSEAAFGKCGIRYLEIDTDKLCPPPAPKARKIEIIGDSITCGYGVEAESELVPFCTATENPTKSYSLLTATALNADANLVSWSGNGIISGYVEETATEPSDKWLMPEVYRYTDISSSERLYGENKSKWEEWDFSRFKPDVILINLGTNDCSWCKEIQERKDHFRDEYVKFLEYVRKNNPQAQILCMLGTMDQRVMKEVQEAVDLFAKKSDDGNVHFLALPPQDHEDGLGADYHPSPRTHQKTAEMVVAEVRRITGWK